MSDKSNAVIISAARTPTGKFLGLLKGFTAPDLAAIAIKEAVKRAGVTEDKIDEVIMGCVVQAGIGQAPARQAALKAGLPAEVSALTINMVCGSGLRAVALASQAVQLGDADFVVAGGMESMSNIPYAMPGAREGYRMANQQVVDLMIHDGLWCPFENWHMGNTGEVVAEKYQITREEQDNFAFNSHRKAAAAQAVSGIEPKLIMMAPVKGVQNVLAKAAWEMKDVDLFELNEAFSVQALGVMKELGLDMEKVNVNGGAVALGHAIGNSGGRVLTTLLYEMKRRNVKRGVAALCLGGGNSVALAVERD